MKLPQFNAEASLGPTRGVYGGNADFGSSSGVLPMLAKQCTNCETVGGSAVSEA